MLCLLILGLLSTFSAIANVQSDLSTCSLKRSCYQGCCSSSGNCSLQFAQLVEYVNTSVSFQASAAASTGSDSDASGVYLYFIYLLYNLGYGAYATITGFPNWALESRNAYSTLPRFTNI